MLPAPWTAGMSMPRCCRNCSTATSSGGFGPTLELSSHRPRPAARSSSSSGGVAAAAHALAVRVQPGKFPPAGSSEPRAVRLHRGARDRERAPAPRCRARPRRPRAVTPADEARVRRPSLRRGHRRRIRGALPAGRRASRRGHDVTVLTTCAKDHITWRNHYPPGESRVGALRVVRFPVARERDLHRFMRSQRSDRRRSRVARRRGGSGSGRTGPMRRRCWRICAIAGATTTACSSGRIATPTCTSACRSSPTARSWCRPRKRIR